MKRCNFCGAEIDDDSMFCNKCGQKIDTIEQQNLTEEKQEVVQPVVKVVTVEVERKKMKFHPVAIIGFALSIIAFISSLFSSIDFIFFSQIFTGSADYALKNLGVSSIFSIITDLTLLPGFIMSIIGLVKSKNKVFGIVGIVLSVLTVVISIFAIIYIFLMIGKAILSGVSGILYYFFYAIVLIFSMGLSVG